MHLNMYGDNGDPLDYYENDGVVDIQGAEIASRN